MELSACSQFWFLLLEIWGFQDHFVGESNTFLCFLSFSVLMQVALHACGVATDMVMEHCIQAGAAFVISPCCYGFIQNAVKFSFPKRCVIQLLLLKMSF